MRIAIIGAGISGLAAALSVKRAGDAGMPIEWVLLEQDRRLGGKILTEHHDGFIIDAGPDCYLAEKPWVGQMAARLGMTDRLLPSNDAEKKTFIYAGGRLHLLPDGTMMMVPTRFLPMLTTSLFSWRGKLRMGLDLFIPKRKNGGDESLGDFVRRRLGAECLDLLAEPMVGGVHASDPDEMSLQATFPRFLQMEQRYGSLIRGFLAARRQAPVRPTGGGATPPSTYFMSFKGGMQELTDAIASAAGRGRMRTGERVVNVEAGSGGQFLIRVDGGEAVRANAILVAAEAYQAAKFLRSLDPNLARLLDAVAWTNAATVSLAFRRDDIPAGVGGWGFLVPEVAKRRIMAGTLSSVKWPGRAPDDHLLVRAFVGGPHNGHLVQVDDNAMIAMVKEELRTILGIVGRPRFARVYRWERGMPQYRLGHLERLTAIERQLEQHPGLYLCGASYRGVGMGDCINSAEHAATRAMDWLRNRAPCHPAV